MYRSRIVFTEVTIIEEHYRLLNVAKADISRNNFPS
jgi:hypothetical protein